ncbi:hypothetical protein TB1_031727 [Malus domestica]
MPPIQSSVQKSKVRTVKPVLDLFGYLESLGRGLDLGSGCWNGSDRRRGFDRWHGLPRVRCAWALSLGSARERARSQLRPVWAGVTRLGLGAH